MCQPSQEAEIQSVKLGMEQVLIMQNRAMIPPEARLFHDKVNGKR